MAAPFDSRLLTIRGAAVRTVEGVMQSPITGAAQYAISSTGTLIYLAGGLVGSEARLTWVDRNGEAHLLPAPARNYQFPRVSPDGRRVGVSIADEESHVWVYDVPQDTLKRLTFEGSGHTTFAWSPDGRIAYRSWREGTPSIFMQALDGSGGAERLTSGDYPRSPSSFSSDRQFLAFIEQTPETGRDVWVLNLADHKPQPFLNAPYDETAPTFSPDGKWLAYSSDESGRREIYLRPYPGPGGNRQISTDGGEEPAWNPRGGELCYRSGYRIMVVDIDTESGFSAGTPRVLFEGPYLPTTASFPYYDVSPDGERFLMLTPVESEASAPTQIHVVLNWFQELKQKSR
jgi:serine/threonine-protein kinase